ncbi:MAG: hypothetical protein RBT49_18655 [Bacteroidales bacterium]|jgi:hypothetical protein|nr:hypothetical protein [Bacteroidales bacterium]
MGRLFEWSLDYKSVRAWDNKHMLLQLIVRCIVFLVSLNTFCYAARSNPNDDNRILKPEKQYLYKELFTDSTGFTRMFYVLLTTQPKPKFNQTLIRYTYYLSLDSLNKNIEYTWEETLATESKKSYEIHPPRANENEIHQLLPFPEIRRNKKINSKWKQTITAFEGWDIPKRTKIVSLYQIVVDTTIMFQGNSIECRKIKAFSKSNLGNGHSDFLFHEDYGFVLIINEINGITTKLELLNVFEKP